ncbi:hypothetical protein V8D89_001366 [Ganoderma adspersum]
MARSNVEHPSAPFAYHPSVSQEAHTSPTVNALLVAIAALLDSHPGNVLDVLHHLSPETPSSVCPSYMAQRLPQRKLLDTLASLIAFHPHCSAAAVALEATPDRVGLYVSASTTHPPSATPALGKGPSLAERELHADVERWLALVHDIARGRTPPSRRLSKTGADDADVMDLPDTQLTVTVFRTCYTILRTRLRALPLATLLRKFENCATTLALVNLANLRRCDADGEAIGELCEHLEMLLRLTEVENAAEIRDARHFVALHVAGRFAARALRDEEFRVLLTGIDGEAVEIVEQACLLSHLVNTLVTTAKSSGTAAALALPWHIEWIAPPPAPSSFEATIDLPLLKEWLGGIAWEQSPFLDRPPDIATWPYSQIVGEILRDAPCGLVRRTSICLGGDDEDNIGRHHYTLARTKNRLLMTASHCEIALLQHLVNPANAVHAYPYVATSHVSCYACTMLARAVGVVRGCEAEFMLRGCEARVDLPWLAGLGDGVVGWGADVVRALEEGLLADLRSLVMDRAEQLVEGRDAGVFESIPEMLNELLMWGR